jgi:ABC-type oligopeptide transport system substrate-binding subunit
VDALTNGLANAKTREDLVAYAKSLDRVLLSGHYVLPLYHNAKTYLAHWNKIEHPNFIPTMATPIFAWWSGEGK